VADREFISAGWLGFLSEREVPFVIRIRSNRSVASGEAEGPALPARTFFRGALAPRGGPERQLEGRCFVGGKQVNVVGKRPVGREDDEFLILIASPGIAARRALRPVPPEVGDRNAFCGDEVARVRPGSHAHEPSAERQ